MRETSDGTHAWQSAGHTRREFLLTTVAGTGFASALAAPSVASGRTTAQSAPQARYIGYVSVRRDNRISIFTMDPATGTLTWQDPVPLDGGPDPMAMDPRKRFLYVACRDQQKLVSYRIDPRTGGLTLIGSVPLQGEPIQIVTDRTGRFLLSVFFYQSTIGVHAISSDGVIAFPPIEWRYTAYGCHGIEVDASNQFVFVPHVARSGGPNAVAQFKFNQKTGRLTPNTPPFLNLHENQGPRHMLVHPTLHVAYSADEQGASATAYRLDPSTGTLSNFQTISTVPGDYTARGIALCSELQISPDGRFLFVVTREHNSIASFAIDATTGRLTDAGRVPTEPAVRPFCLDPDGRFAVAAGSGAAGSGGAAARGGGTGGRLATYRVNRDNGQLTPLAVYPGGDGPMWILMNRLTV
jgi:6-phosphogluconolactonase